MFIGIIVGISYAFFNYTKTGPVNLLSTGGITFTSDYESVTLNNVYPTSIYSYETDNDNVATIELNISGYTNTLNGSSVFDGTSNIVGGAGTTYSSSHINVEYARIDDPSNNKPGYFTYKATSGT